MRRRCLRSTTTDDDDEAVVLSLDVLAASRALRSSVRRDSLSGVLADELRNELLGELFAVDAALFSLLFIGVLLRNGDDPSCM